VEVGKAALFVALALTAAVAPAAPRHAPVPGGVARIVLPAGNTTASFGDSPVLVIEGVAYVGLPLSLAPGLRALRLADGSELAFLVRDKKYPVQHVKLRDRGKVDLSPENEARAAREIAEINRYKTLRSENDRPDLDFAAPVVGRRSGVFGARRVFNGQPRAPHVGLDFAVPVGTPVRSAASGKVIGTGDYFFNGKTVYVDHGQGLISMYCHLDSIDVEVGQSLARGAPLGRSGASGRASGPHLHWSVILNGVMVDPALWLPVARPAQTVSISR
jgi:murein DD-endopeptidase MepM/ murein hydrolase activator NlpD